jgi:competence protein ComEC
LAVAAWAAQRRRQIDSARRPPRTSDSAAAPRSARGHRLLWVGAVAFLAASAAWAWTGRNVPLRVTILNVGAGSATAIEFPNGQTWLYDVGSLTRPAAGRSVVVPYLEYRGIRRIDRVILSHANTDHYNGLLDVLGEVPAGPVVTNPYFEEHSGPRSASRFLLRVLGQRGQPIEHIDAGVQPVELGGVTVETLWPPAPTAMEADAGLAPNDASTVIRLTYAGRSILLTGDIEEQAERALIQRGGLSADVLILPHHGSVEPSSKEFIDAVDPQLVIRSSNEPMARTDNGLEYVVGNRPLYNTADDGAVTIRIDETGSGIAVATAIPRR